MICELLHGFQFGFLHLFFYLLIIPFLGEGCADHLKLLDLDLLISDADGMIASANCNLKDLSDIAIVISTKVKVFILKVTLQFFVNPCEIVPNKLVKELLRTAIRLTDCFGIFFLDRVPTAAYLPS